MIRIIDEGILYRNPKPGLRAIHASFPCILELSPTELICAYRRGQAFQSHDGRIYLLRSTDGGKTWNDEGPVWDGTKDRIPCYYAHTQLTKLSNGTILLVSSRFDARDPERLMYNEVTNGYSCLGGVLFRSYDHGHTWSEPQEILWPAGIVANPSSTPILELSHGRLMLTIETWKAWDDPSPAYQRAMALFSDDGGYTWGEMTTIADRMDENIYNWDTRVIHLGNDRLLGMIWTHDATTDTDLPIHIVRSEDGGRTWSKPASTGIEGQVVGPAHLGGRRILAVYNRRFHERPGIMAILSEDEGHTWDMEHQVMIWDAVGQTRVGAATEQRKVTEQVTFSFGLPSVRQVAGGDALACFWCTQDCVTHIRWVRLRVE